MGLWPLCARLVWYGCVCNPLVIASVSIVDGVLLWLELV